MSAQQSELVLQNTILELVAALHASQKSEKLLSAQVVDLQHSLVQNSEQLQHKQREQSIAYDRLQADYTSYRHTADLFRRGEAGKQEQCRDRLHEQQEKELRFKHAEGQRAVKQQINLQAINTEDYQNRAQQQQLNHTRALQLQKAGHRAELAAQQADAAALYQALHNKCSRQQKAISVQIQKQHADKIKHCALLSAATIHLQQPTSTAERRRVKLLANVTNHTIKKHLPAMLIKGKPGPKPADIPPSTPTVGLRPTQVGNATPTSSYDVKFHQVFQKQQTDGSMPTSRATACAHGAAYMLLSDPYHQHLPAETTLREARQIMDAIYVKAIKGEKQKVLARKLTPSRIGCNASIIRETI